MKNTEQKLGLGVTLTTFKPRKLARRWNLSCAGTLAVIITSSEAEALNRYVAAVSAACIFNFAIPNQ